MTRIAPPSIRKLGFLFCHHHRISCHSLSTADGMLMLVCAFAGRERVLEAYREAVQRGYRFYSFGDAMIIL